MTAALRLLERAVRNHWQIPEDLAKELPDFAAEMMRTANDERSRIRAAELIVSMNKANVDLAIAVDKVNRLDDGTSTENQSVKVEFVNRITPSES
jgi:hypothetical protein